MDLKKGIIHLTQIRKDAIEHSFSTASPEPWLNLSLVNAAPEWEDDPQSWASKVKIEGQVKIQKIDPEYMLEGSYSATVQASCSRCGDEFPAQRQSEFRLFYKPVEKSKYIQEDEPSDDPDYNFLDKEYISVADVLTEQIVVQEPMVECPDRSDDGTCKLCGKNPQFAGQV
ncbi:MAG: DUF177 domain-containing protein [Proteobacteria bacterium]|nr:DUF177 domain-containing protein [Pseudomonadota bacterium]